MRRVMLVVLGLALLTVAAAPTLARYPDRSCEVPLVWGDAFSVASLLPSRSSARIEVQPEFLVVGFAAADGSVRLVEADSCRAIAVMTRN